MQPCVCNGSGVKVEVGLTARWYQCLRAQTILGFSFVMRVHAATLWTNCQEKKVTHLAQTTCMPTDVTKGSVPNTNLQLRVFP